jgi:hypothetical protein
MATTLDKLVELMPPPERPTDNKGDWSKLEKKLHTPFPDDYKEFVARYGAGMIGELPIYVYTPFRKEPLHGFEQQAKAVTKAVKELLDDTHQTPPLFPKKDGLLPWGSDGNGNYFFWKTTGKPNEWPITILDMAAVEFVPYARTLVDFLTSLFKGKLKFSLYSDAFRPPIKFVAYKT